MSQATQLSTFNFEQSSIRVIAVNNEPWFVATDICRSLNIVNVSDALLKLDDDEKATVGLTDSQAGHGAQSISIISESGMYTLILRCRDAVKKGSVPHRFRKWVTSEVLPQIRKTGQYSQNSQQILPVVEPEPTYTFEFTEYELEQLAWLAFSHKQMNDLLEILIQPMDAIGSRYSAMVYSHHHEYKRHYSESLDTVRRLIEPFKQSKRMNWERVVKRLN